MKNHAAATVRNRILKGAALCGVLALSMTLTGCFVPPDDLSGDLSNQGVVYNTVAVTAPQRTATPTPSPTPTVESVFNFGTNTVMPTTQPGVITSNGIVTVVTTPPGSVATTARPTATPTPTAAAVLKKGSSGADVKTLQRRLKQLGYYTGSVDGDFGDATEKALRAFQDRNNLLVDGIAGKSTMAKLNSSNAVKAAAATATPRKTATPKPKTTATPNLSTEYYLQSGSSGTRVRTLQARLIELGWMAGSPDGNYEGATEYAVKAFQKKYKSLYTDGVAGPSTLQTLYSSSAAKSSTPVSSIGTTLESGMKNSGAVKAMQTRLKSLGYLTGTADGSFGDATKAAVIAFQTANGLKADGKAGTSTLNRLYSDAAIAASSMPTATASTSVDGYTTLSEGDTGTAVRNLQKALKNKGYYSGSVDGKYGAATTAAVVAFQSAQGLRVDGKAGPATQRALFTTSSSTDTSKYTTLRPGDSGAAIRQLQTTLKQKGYYTGTIDGDYGSGTTAAVKAFQKKYNLTADGIAGKETLKKLDSVYENANSAKEDGSLRMGDSGSAVKDLQTKLKKLGYYDGTVDSTFGSGTYAAVKAFQKKYNLTADGVAGSETLKKLDSAYKNADSDKDDDSLRKGKGATGTAVKTLQTNLKKLGFYTAYVDGSFGATTESAVKAFQKKYGLTADGVAGSATLKKIESAVASASSGKITTERLDWFNGGKNVIPNGAVFQIKDVSTGLIFSARRQSGGNHMDAEPLTAEDTAILKKINGGTFSWRRRAVLVKYNGHVYAASIYSEPHGTNTILDNNFDGQFCLHFYGSKTHGTDRVDADHQRCVEQAMKATW